MQEKYLYDSQVAVFGISTQIKYVPLYVHSGWKNKHQLHAKVKGGMKRQPHANLKEVCK